MYIDIVHFFLKRWGGGEYYPVRSSISGQGYFYAKYNKNALTTAIFFLISRGKNNT